jgi:hypothetical protein
MSNFMEVLNKRVDEVEKPKPRPVGSYVASIAGLPKTKDVKTKDGDREVLSFSCKLLMAREDVDQEQLADHGDISAWPPMSKDFWDGPEALWQITQFLTKVLVIDDDGGSKTVSELVAESPGKQFIVTLGHRPYVDKQGEPAIQTEIAGVAAL